jgi:hypothetical protein
VFEMKETVLQPRDGYCNAKEESMPGIDLSLAVNYIPAVECLSKTISIVSSMAFVDERHDLGAFLIIALMLNIDRVFACTRIFDGNAVLCTLLGSWIINFLRVSGEAPKFLNPFVTTVWCCFALCLLVEPGRLKPFILSESEQGGPGGWGMSERIDVSPGGGRIGRLKRIAPVLVTTFCVGTIAFTRMEQEGWAMRFGRAMSFSGLCVVWVYLVGVWRRSGGVLNTFTQNLVGRFCPILFVNSVCAILFFVACLVGFGYLYYVMHYQPPGLSGQSSVSSEFREDPVTQSPIMTTIIEEETDEDLEAYFRSARQGQMGVNV